MSVLMQVTVRISIIALKAAGRLLAVYVHIYVALCQTNSPCKRLLPSMYLTLHIGC